MTETDPKRKTTMPARRALAGSSTAAAPALEVPGKWWRDGVRFECQGSGRCCVSRGEYGYVYMTAQDRRNAAAALGMTPAAFTRRYCSKTDGFFHLKDGDGPACLFLEGNRCAIYQGRPTQCRTWPFWPEVMSPKAWKAEVAAYCPGVGKGKLWSKEEIERNLGDQIKSERELAHQAVD